MILSGQFIAFEDIVQPFTYKQVQRGMSRGCSHCGYDVQFDHAALDYGESHRITYTPDGDGVTLRPKEWVLLPIAEHFTMPDDVVGLVRDKSTWARQGIMVAQAVLEPGWRGHLALGVFNASGEDVTIVDGDPIAQVLFHRVTDDSAYDGKYQDQPRGQEGPRHG